MKTLKKIELSVFQPYVNAWFPRLLPYLPAWLTANRVTLLGLAGSALACACLYLTSWSRWMFLAGDFFVFTHWFADTLDGVVARARGPTRLGHYLDNFCDALAVMFIGVGVFLSAGSHWQIGLVIVILYQLHVIHALVKAEITRVVVLPAYGPTEVHLTIIMILTAQIWIDYGRPLSWLPALTGDNGGLTRLLGFDRGLTLVDVFGLVMVVALGVMLAVEVGGVYKTFKASN